MFSNVIIIESSDDDEQPKKKIKLDKSKNRTSTVDNIRISNVTSLSELDDDIVVIEDDDSQSPKNENNVAPDQKEIMNNNLENGVTKVEIENFIDTETQMCKDTEKIFIGDSAAKCIEPEIEITSVTTCLSNGNIPDDNKQDIEEITITKECVSVINHVNAEINDVQHDSVQENENVPSVSTTIPVMTEEFKNFLDVCSSSNVKQKYSDAIQKKLPSIKEHYCNTESDFLHSKSFLKLLKRKTDLIKEKPTNTIVYFNDIYQELKARRKRETSRELSNRERKHLKKLEKAMRLIYKKIQELEEAPVDWDDDNDSAYIQLDRYRKRFNDIYIKICCYTGESIYAGRQLYRKLDFAESKHSEINRSIDSWYNKNRSFPTYHDLEKCIRKCVNDKKLNLSECEIEIETRKVFTALGNLIQRRRKYELQDTLSDYLGITKDPALEDHTLKSTLDDQFKIGIQKIEAIFNEFSERQQKGEEPSVSSDSDDSHQEHTSDTD